MQENFEKGYLIGIAKAAHYANALVCDVLNDGMEPLPWEATTEDYKNILINDVAMVLSTPNPTPEQYHENWLKVKRSEGWIYGEKKNDETKEHPFLVPYNQLTVNQRVNYSVFVSFVKSLHLADPKTIKDFGGYVDDEEIPVSGDEIDPNITSDLGNGSAAPSGDNIPDATPGAPAATEAPLPQGAPASPLLDETSGNQVEKVEEPAKTEENSAAPSSESQELNSEGTGSSSAAPVTESAKTLENGSASPAAEAPKPGSPSPAPAASKKANTKQNQGNATK